MAAFRASALAAAGCTAAASLTGPWFCFSLAFSPDERNVYLGSCGDLTIFSRNADGGLTQTGCIDANGPPDHLCAGDTGTEPQTSIAITPDGKNLYFAFNIGRSNPTTHTAQVGGVTVFARATNGSLTRLGGINGCLTETGSHGACTKAHGLESPARARAQRRRPQPVHQRLRRAQLLPRRGRRRVPPRPLTNSLRHSLGTTSGVRGARRDTRQRPPAHGYARAAS